MASLIKTPNVNISFDSALSFKLETLEFLKWFRIGTPLNSLLSQPLTTKDRNLRVFSTGRKMADG